MKKFKHDVAPNTPEWLELRKGFRTASEAAIVLGISPFTTPKKFKQIKAGVAKQFYSKAMALGHEKEEMIREWAEERLGKKFLEEIWTCGKYLASLDGRASDGTVLEIKCSSHTYNSLTNGEMPEHYLSQIQQQLFCSGGEEAYLAAWCPKTDQYVISDVIHFDPGFMDRVDAAWAEFDAMPVPEGDVDVSDNQTLEQLFIEYQSLKEEKEDLDVRMGLIKDSILEFAAPDRAVVCRGYRISYVKPTTRVDYKKAATDAKLDLEPYTKIAPAGSYTLKMAPPPFEAEDD